MQIHSQNVNTYRYSPAQRSHHSWQSRSSKSQSLTTKSRPKQTTSIHQSIRLCWLNRVNRTALKNRHQNSQDSQLHIKHSQNGQQTKTCGTTLKGYDSCLRQLIIVPDHLLIIFDAASAFSPTGSICYCNSKSLGITTQQ